METNSIGGASGKEQDGDPEETKATFFLKRYVREKNSS